MTIKLKFFLFNQKNSLFLDKNNTIDYTQTVNNMHHKKKIYRAGKYSEVLQKAFYGRPIYIVNNNLNNLNKLNKLILNTEY